MCLTLNVCTYANMKKIFLKIKKFAFIYDGLPEDSSSYIATN